MLACSVGMSAGLTMARITSRIESVDTMREMPSRYAISDASRLLPVPLTPPSSTTSGRGGLRITRSRR